MENGFWISLLWFVILSAIPRSSAIRTAGEPNTPIILPLMNYNNRNYFGDIEVGTPPQKLRVLFDTGSTTFIIVEDNDEMKKCSDLYKCAFFKTKKSNTIEENEETFEAKYVDGNTYTGNSAIDYVKIGGSQSEITAKIILGLAKSANNNYNGASGIFGLGFPNGSRLNSQTVAPFESLMEKSGLPQQFSMYAKRETYVGRYENSGELYIGGYDLNHMEADGFVTKASVVEINGLPTFWVFNVDSKIFLFQNHTLLHYLHKTNCAWIMAALVQVPQQQPQKKDKKCWPAGHKYGGACLCKCKLRYIQPDRPQSFKPIASFKPPDCKINDGTTYNMSYYGFDPNVVRNCRGKPIIAKENLVSAGDFSSDTTHKMSYGAWPGFKPPTVIVPTDHKLIGDGPLSELTTHKHDYTPKPLQDVEKVVHPGNLGFSKDPMEDRTTQNMSYQVPDYNRFEAAISFKPNKIFNPPSAKMDDKTTHKLSYQPFCPPEKEEFPWAQKPKYKAPTVRFDGSTVYNGSYLAPGQFIEDCVGPEGCYCQYPGECFDSSGEPPKAHEFDVCPTGYNPKTCQPRPPPLICDDCATASPNRYDGSRDLSREC